MAKQHERPDPPATTNTRILDHLDDALGSLPEFQRQILLLRFAEGLSFGQIGRRVGKSADACQKHASRALEFLRGRLSRRTAGLTVATLTATLSAALQTPASGASVISKLALASSSSIPTQKVLIHSLILMKTSTKIALSAAAIALIGTAPLVIRSASHQELVTGHRHVTADATKAPSGPSGRQAPVTGSTDESQHPAVTSAPRTPAEPGVSAAPVSDDHGAHFVAAWEEMIRGRMGDGSSVSPKEPLFWRALGEMKPDEAGRIIDEFDAMNVPAEVQGMFVCNMINKLRNNCPPDFLVRRFAGYAASGDSGVTMQITGAMRHWVKTDPDGAKQWFNEQSRGGVLESKRLDGAAPVRDLLQKVFDDPDGAMEAQLHTPKVVSPESH